MMIVTLQSGEKKEAALYYTTTIVPSLKPFRWYKEHVLRGAMENNLPADYIAELEKVQSVADADLDRHKHEMSLYR
jgi:hypothetical protein